MTLAQEVRQRTSADVILLLLTITHASLEAPVRIVRNDEDIRSNQETFYAFPFDFLFEARGEDQSQQAAIDIPFFSAQLLALMRASKVSPQITLEIALASDPNDIEQSFEDLTLDGVEYDATRISGIIARPQLMTRVAPYLGFTLSNFPGIL